jgi:anti-sigma B factor antagonist
MIIESERTGKASMTLSLSGRIDTSTAALLERKLKQVGDDITELTLDFQKLHYISSMGLRVLLQAHKAMKGQNRKLIIINMTESIREIFAIAGFINLMVNECGKTEYI